MAYPSLERQFSEDEMIIHFSLTAQDNEFLKRFLKDTNRLGAAVLLISYKFLGYPEYKKESIPFWLIERIAANLGVPSELFQRYKWSGRGFRYHLMLVREHFNMRCSERNDYPPFISWLTQQVNKAPSRRELKELSIRRFRETGIELPPDGKLRCLINSARDRYFKELYKSIYQQISSVTGQQLENCLEVTERDGESSDFDWIKSSPGRIGMKTIRNTY